MKYKFNQTNYHTFETFEDNVLEPRAYFVPYPNKQSAKGIDILDYRKSSPFINVLNGMWDFKFYRNPNDFPAEVETDDLSFDSVPVPSCIQLEGYDIPMYINMKYLFYPHPPRIPTLNPVGVFPGANNANPTHLKLEIHNEKDVWNFVMLYRKKFYVNDINKDLTLRFFGVCSCYDLYINGHYVGYAEGSHNIHDFDINNYAVNGENEMVVVVHRWCNGTYLECQDMFRYNGIFRDVILYEEDKTRIYDFDFSTSKTKKGYNFKLNANVLNPKGFDIKLSITGTNVEYSKTIKASSLSEFEGSLNPIEWNPEIPTLYTLELELITDNKTKYYIKKNVGFKSVVIDKDIFYFNDKKIKMLGVNHHDTNPKTGFVMTPEDINKDLVICKEYGINTIRTSHYPPDPLLIELADIYGFYIVAEADIETHGLSHFNSKSPKISNNLKWKNHFLDRAHRLYNPLKNNVSITMWSLGNEAGGIACQNEMEKYFKSVTNIPLHYESTIYCDRVHFDVTSMMYPSIPYVHSVGAKTMELTEHNKKVMEVPYFLCEYAHAMGVGPGCLEEYVDEFLNYDSLMGGCIWEFADHAVFHPNGPNMYTYGGDHGEYWHDGNFCCDGLFYPDRTPSSGAKNMKFAYRPIRIRRIDGNNFELFYTNSFKPLSDYDITYTISNGIKESHKKSIKVLAKPFEKAMFTIDDIPAEGNVFINFYTQDKTNNYTMEEQIIIREVITSPSIEKVEKPSASGNKDLLKVSFKNGNVSFNKKTGSLSYTYKDSTIIESSNKSLCRVKMDNDCYDCISWNRKGLTSLKESLLSLKLQQSKDAIVVTTKTLMHAKLLKFNITDVYTIYNDGTIHVKSTLKKSSKKISLPRFGVTYKLDDSFKNVNYLGRKDESYIDFCNHTPVALNHFDIKDMMEPNLRPQETGNRCNTQFTNVSNSTHTISFVADKAPYELAMKTMSDASLWNMKHREDVFDSNESFVTISNFNMGVGTGICGPATLPKYTRLTDKDYVLEFFIKPNN